MKRYFVLALIVFAGILPFSSRAVFIDEHIFLKIAHNALDNWEFPQDIPSVFFGEPLANFAAHTHPPVGEYYLALVYRLVGHFSEIPFRLCFSVFSILAILAFYSIALRFTEQAFWVSILFALSPAFFVLSPTVMMDIPMLAFLLCGIAFYFAYLDGHRPALIVAAACFVLSVGTGYTALIPLGCLFISMLIGRRPWKELLAVLSAPLALTAWQVLMTVHFGAFPLTKTVAYYSGQSRLLGNVRATVSFIGGVTLFPWAVFIVTENLRKLHLAAIVALAAILAAGTSRLPLFERAWYLFFAGSGILLIWAFMRASRRIMVSSKNTGEAFLLLWVPATLAFFIVVADMINARYILLSTPAFYLVLFRYSTARQLKLLVVPTAVLSVCIAYSDFVFVNSYREWVRQTVVPLEQEGFNAWSATESGLRFYLEEQGLSTLTAQDVRPRGMDLVISHDLFRYGLAEELATVLTPLKRFTLSSSFPLRTFNRESGAGFWDSGIGLAPFSISLEPLDHVEIDEVSPFVRALPQRGIPAEEVPAWSPNGVILKQNVDVREFKLKIPANSKLEYELVGRGTAELTTAGIVLRRAVPETIVWRRFRIVPAQLAREGN